MELILVSLAQVLELDHKMEDQIQDQVAAAEETGGLVMVLMVL